MSYPVNTGMRVRTGTFWFNTGDMYNGEFVDGFFHGQGSSEALPEYKRVRSVCALPAPATHPHSSLWLTSPYMKRRLQKRQPRPPTSTSGSATIRS
jgi:hypothetical protein